MRVPRIEVKDNMRNLIITYLKELGIPAQMKGYYYLKEAIEMEIKDPLLVEKMTTKLYPDIAKVWETTPSRVERAIRHSIEVAFSRCDPKILEAYFMNTIDPMKGKPTNGEFIANVAEMVRMEMKAYD